MNDNEKYNLDKYRIELYHIFHVVIKLYLFYLFSFLLA